MDLAETPSPQISAAELTAKSSLSVASLQEAIELQALAWIVDDPGQRLVIPRPNFKEMKADLPLPAGVEVTFRPLKGRKVTVRNRPSGFQIISARWPDDGLETKRFPMVGCALRGTADLRINNYILSCEEGRFVLIADGIPHPDGTTPHIEVEGGHDHGRRCDILWFCPMGDVLKCWICRSENGKHTGLPTVYFKRQVLCDYCDALFEDFSDRSPTRTRIRQGLLMTLMSSVLNEIEQGRYFRWLPQVGAPPDDEETDPIKRAHIYIRQHISEPLTMDSVARHCYMSRSQFAKLFPAGTGETFNQFVTRCRLEEAKLRLTTTTAQISGIARHVGLKPRHFNDLIRIHTGMTPGDYRKQNRDEANSW